MTFLYRIDDHNPKNQDFRYPDDRKATTLYAYDKIQNPLPTTLEFPTLLLLRHYIHIAPLQRIWNMSMS